MPRVKIDYIVSFSNEDPDNPAGNLLGWEVSKKRWLCPKGEPSCSVVLQLTKAVKMSAVHIGAHQAALVEVLVGRSETPNEPFQVLVPSCVFLSPSESRKSDCMERVRSFSQLQLTDARHQRWDRLRVVCSQPYNKHCKYGLNFVHVDEFEGKESAPVVRQPAPTPEVAALPLPTLDQSSDEDEFRPGELFKQQRLSIDPKTQNTDTGAQIRQATSQALKNITDSATKLVKTPISKQNKRQSNTEGDFGANRQRDSLMYTDDDDKPHAKIDHVVQRHKDDQTKDETSKDKHKARLNDSRTNDNKHPDKKDRNKTTDKHENKNTDKSEKDRTSDKHEVKNTDKLNRNKKHSDTERRKDNGEEDRNSKPSHSSRDVNNGATTSSNGLANSNKRPRERKQKNEKVEVGSILSGVTLVLSGYVNPERTQLRDLALAMGARCRRDWEPACTHLICAFPNTPKLRVVRAGPSGGSVPVARAEWLRACRRRRRRLPWRWFATEPSRALDPDPTTDEESAGGPNTDDEDTDDEIQKVLHQAKRARRSPDAARPPPDEASHLDLSTSSDVAFVKDERIKARVTISSDDDTTDEDTAGVVSRPERIDPSKSLPAMFEGLTFVVGADVTDAEGALLRRYLRAYGGLVIEEEHLDEDSSVDYVICAEPSRRPAGGPRPVPAGPGWVWRCHRAKALLPTGPP